MIQDLVKGDGLEKELKVTKDLLTLKERKLILKDSIISSLNSKLYNVNSIVDKKDRQFMTQQELSTSLENELKKQKSTTFFYKVLSGVGAVLSIIFLIK